MKAAPGTILISQDQIRRRIAELGQTLKRLRGAHRHVCGNSEGSFIFLADVIRAVSPEIPVEVDFMSVSSYGDAMTTSGTIHIEKDLAIPIDGKDVIIVEDIVDTGLTLLHVYNILSARGARSSRRRTIGKAGNLKYDHPLDYIGFKIPNKFVVGFGLDYAQKFRNLSEIRILDEV